MVSVYRTNQGWTYHVPAKTGYYNSLEEVMDAAYAAENRQADHHDLLEPRDRPCHNCRFAAGG
jgi:hypothetical protein